MNTIYDGSFVLGQTSATNFIAGPGIKIDQPSEGVVRIGNDETVLYSNDTGTSAATLSEAAENFDRLKVWITREYSVSYVEIPKGMTGISYNKYGTGQTSWAGFSCNEIHPAGNTVALKNGVQLSFYTSGGIRYVNKIEGAYGAIVKVIGINRISGSNA